LDFYVNRKAIRKITIVQKFLKKFFIVVFIISFISSLPVSAVD